MPLAAQAHLLFTDKQVTAVRRMHPAGKLCRQDCPDSQRNGLPAITLVALPEFAKGEFAQAAVIETWTLFAQIVQFLKRQLREKLAANGLKSIPNDEVLFLLRYRQGCFRFEIAQSWAADLLGLPKSIKDTCIWELYTLLVMELL